MATTDILTGTHSSNSKTLTFTDSAFDTEVLKADTPVLVDFWAEWCGPCRAMTPTIDAIAADYSGKAKIGKLNVDDHGLTAQKYGIRSIPALLLFKDGKVVEQKIGGMSKSDLQKMIDAHL